MCFDGRLLLRLAVAVVIFGSCCNGAASQFVSQFWAPKSPWISRPNSGFVYQFNFGHNVWRLARESCLSRGGDLVSLEDQAELDWLLSYFAVVLLASAERVLIVGLRNWAPEFERGLWRWVGGRPLNTSFIRWMPGEPTNVGGAENCAVFLVKERQLIDANCDVPVTSVRRTRFVCKASREALLKAAGVKRPCPQGWTRNENGCFRLFRLELDWLTANLFCEGWGARLAKGDTEEKRRFLNELAFFRGQPFEYWLGASDEGREGRWQWSDGSELSLDKESGWQPSVPPYPFKQPDGGEKANCLAMTIYGLLQDYCCRCEHSRLRFVCERPAFF